MTNIRLRSTHRLELVRAEHLSNPRIRNPSPEFITLPSLRCTNDCDHRCYATCTGRLGGQPANPPNRSIGMGSLIRWDPLHSASVRELQEMNDRFSRLFERLSSGQNGNGNEAMTVADWMPTVDIGEDQK